MHSVQGLKQQYKTLAAAKAALGVTARGWDALVAKLNASPTGELDQLRQEIAQLKAQIAQLQQVANPTGFWLLDGNFDRSRFPDFGVPNEAFYKESVAKAFHQQLARQFHPDKGGSAEQMANLNTNSTTASTAKANTRQ